MEEDRGENGADTWWVQGTESYACTIPSRRGGGQGAPYSIFKRRTQATASLSWTRACAWVRTRSCSLTLTYSLGTCASLVSWPVAFKFTSDARRQGAFLDVFRAHDTELPEGRQRQDRTCTRKEKERTSKEEEKEQRESTPLEIYGTMVDLVCFRLLYCGDSKRGCNENLNTSWRGKRIAEEIILVSIFYPKSLEIVRIDDEVIRPRGDFGKRITLESNVVIYERVKETPRRSRKEISASLCEPMPYAMYQTLFTRITLILLKIL